MFVYLNRFHQYAVKHNLSAAAILLWQSLYLCMAGSNQFERLQQDTAVLMQALQITRQGLIGVRKSLERAGLLAVERDENQRLWYTLQLDGKALQPVGEEAQPATDQPNEAAAQTIDELPALQSEQACCALTDDEQEAGAVALGSTRDEKINRPAIATMQPSAQKNRFPTSNDNVIVAALEAENRREDSATFLGIVSSETWSSVQSMAFSDQPAPTGDIVMNKEYPVYLKAFCSRYSDSSLHSSLTSWMQQREQNGWTLTLWGLEELLKKLVQLAAGEIETMAAIVKQSIKRRWKGFHALKTKSRPSGEKLLKLEEKEQRAYEKAHPKQPAIVRKLFGIGEATDEDLSFLEE